MKMLEKKNIFRNKNKIKKLKDKKNKILEKHIFKKKMKIRKNMIFLEQNKNILKKYSN